MSKKFYVYLAGPIAKCHFDQVTSWRKEVADKLPGNVIALDPMRDKDYLTGKVIKDIKSTHFLTNANGVMSRDRNDVLFIADLFFANFLGASEISKGTMIELGWADSKRIPIILVMEEGNIHNHPMVRQAAHHITDNLEKGIEIVASYFSFGKNL